MGGEGRERPAQGGVGQKKKKIIWPRHLPAARKTTELFRRIKKPKIVPKGREGTLKVEGEEIKGND